MSSTATKQQSARLTNAVLEAAYWKGVVQDTYTYTDSPRARAKAECCYHEALDEAKRIAEEEQDSESQDQ